MTSKNHIFGICILFPHYISPLEKFPRREKRKSEGSAGFGELSCSSGVGINFQSAKLGCFASCLTYTYQVSLLLLLKQTTMKPVTITMMTTTIDSLPRSIRWRLQLGLISKPAMQNWTLDDLLLSDENVDMIATQRNNAQLLLHKHNDDLQQALHPRDVWIDQTLDPLSQLVQLHEAENAKWQELASREIQRRSSMSHGREEALPLSVSRSTSTCTPGCVVV